MYLFLVTAYCTSQTGLLAKFPQQFYKKEVPVKD